MNDERYAMSFVLIFNRFESHCRSKSGSARFLCGVKDGGYLNLLCNTIAPMAVRNPARLTATETNSSKNFKMLIVNAF